MNLKRPHLAILGAGPTGLEAALAASANGFPFTLYEAARTVAGHMSDWGHVELFSPWCFNISPRARETLSGAGIELPAEHDRSCPTGAQVVARVLEPIARLDAIQGHLRTDTRVVGVGRERLLKHEEISSEERGSRPFRLLLRDHSGGEWTESADVVIDCTGSYSHPNSLGDGGIPAPGETALDSEIARRIPNLALERADWAGKRILLIGAGYSALTAVADLADLAGSEPGTSIAWALRREQPDWRVDPEDPLPGRSALALRANQLASGASPAVQVIAGVVVDSIDRDPDGFRVRLRRIDGEFETIRADKILSLTGAVGDHKLYRQLQIHECYATLGPMKLSAALLGSESSDCLAQESQGPETLLNPEPGFFILGAKSYGRNASFLMRLGWKQVDEVFELLGGSGRRVPAETVAVPAVDS